MRGQEVASVADKAVGDVIRFGLGSRNWLLAQLDGADELYTWKPPGGGRSAEEILTHVAWGVSAVCSQIAAEIGLVLKEPKIAEQEGIAARLKAEVTASYELFTELCEKIDGHTLEKIIELPPPGRVGEGTIERVLRIITGYHVVHHAGQIAMVLSMATKAR